MKEIINKCPLFIGIKQEDIEVFRKYFFKQKYKPKEIISYQMKLAFNDCCLHSSWCNELYFGKGFNY